MKEAAGMKLIILDRDGVINHDSTPSSSRPTSGSRSRVRWKRSRA
jgi:histidinol phosphatase-like enzyme